MFSFSDGKGSDVLCMLTNPRACGKLCRGKTGLCRTTAVLVPPGRVGTDESLGNISGTLATSPTEEEFFDVLRILPSTENV